MIPHLSHLPFMIVSGDIDSVGLQRHLTALNSRSNSESDISAYAESFARDFEPLTGFDFDGWFEGENKEYVTAEIECWLFENTTLQVDEIEIMAQDIYGELSGRTNGAGD